MGRPKLEGTYYSRNRDMCKEKALDYYHNNRLIRNEMHKEYYRNVYYPKKKQERLALRPVPSFRVTF
jgi:hypothetical protein